MPNFRRPDTVDQLLYTSKQAINAYHDQIGQSSLPKSPKIDPVIINNLKNLLDDTYSALDKEISENTVFHIKPSLVQDLDHSIESLINDPATATKVQIPFLEILQRIQNLLQTLKNMKGSRGREAASLEDLDNSYN